VPQCNAIAERFVRSIKSECLDRLIFLGEEHLKSSLKGFEEYYNQRRNHQGLDNRLLTPQALPREGRIRRRKELGGLLNYYYRQAA
jgi:putative transposase